MSTQLSLPLSERAAAPPPAARRSRSIRLSYDAGAHSRRTLRWHAPTQSPNAAVLANLTTMRDRSRAAVRNDGFAKGIIDTLVSDICGYGIKPQSQAADPEFRRAVQELWSQWVDEKDPEGVLTWYGQLRQAVRSWLEAGEVFMRLRPRMPGDMRTVPLQVQVIEAELCPLNEDRALRNGNKLRAGVEYNGIGKRVAYVFYASRPGDPNEWDTSDLRRVPADVVLHLFDPWRPGQIRGIPHLTQALIRLHELLKYDDATLLRNQLANLFALFVTQDAGDSSSDLNPLTGLEADDEQDDRPVVALEPGISHSLDPGEDVKFSQPPDPPATYPQFMKQQLMSACASAGVPYTSLTGDMSGVNDRTVRVILNDYRRRIMAWQHTVVVPTVCQAVWEAWLDAAFFSGALRMPADYAMNPYPWSAVKWIPQGWPYIHPVQDVQSAEKAVLAGFKSRADVVSEQGEDVELVDADQAADNERAEKLGLKYSTTTDAAALQPPPPAAPPSAPPNEGAAA